MKESRVSVLLLCVNDCKENFTAHVDDDDDVL